MDKWITDKDPDRPGEYLCTVYSDTLGYDYVTICYYSCRPWHGVTGWSHNYDKDLTSDDVIAWQHLPDPYEQKDE